MVSTKILKAMDSPQRDIYGAAAPQSLTPFSDGHCRLSIDHNPMLSPMLVTLKRKPSARNHYNTFDLKPFPLVNPVPLIQNMKLSPRSLL